jgi:hypothetical protein
MNQGIGFGIADLPVGGDVRVVKSPGVEHLTCRHCLRTPKGSCNAKNEWDA